MEGRCAALGAGGMGVVYLAERDGQYAALKVIHARFVSDPVFVARFRREVQVGRTVGGRYVALVLDADPDAQPPWFAAEYVPGRTLARTSKITGRCRRTRRSRSPRACSKASPTSTRRVSFTET